MRNNRGRGEGDRSKKKQDLSAGKVKKDVRGTVCLKSSDILHIVSHYIQSLVLGHTVGS